MAFTGLGTIMSVVSSILPLVAAGQTANAAATGAAAASTWALVWPVLVVVAALLALVAIIALVAYAFRDKLAEEMNNSAEAA